MKLTKNFYLSEFACNDGTQVPEEYIGNVKLLAKNLQVLRDYIGEPINISGSGYRTYEWNKKVGGATRSLHLSASAADISAKNYSPRRLTRIIRKLIKKGKMTQGGLGLYNGFVHYDVRGYKARWDSSSLFNW